MKLENFERLVHKALTKIPQDLRSYLDNVDIVVEDWPARDQLAGHIVDEDELLLGDFESGEGRAVGAAGPGGGVRQVHLRYGARPS